MELFSRHPAKVSEMLMKARLSTACLAFLLPLVVAPCSYGWYGKAVVVEQGCRITVQGRAGRIKVILYGIECPRSGQPFGNKALYLTCWLVLGKRVQVIPIGIDSGEEIPALVRVEGNRDFLNAQLIAYGMAWLKNPHPVIPLCHEWKKLEELAKIHRIGLWATSGAGSPAPRSRIAKPARVSPVERPRNIGRRHASVFRSDPEISGRF